MEEQRFGELVQKLRQSLKGFHDRVLPILELHRIVEETDVEEDKRPSINKLKAVFSLSVLHEAIMLIKYLYWITACNR